MINTDVIEKVNAQFRLLITQIEDRKAEIKRLRQALSKLLNCVDGIHTQAHLERCKIEARAALQPKEGV